MTWVRGLVVGLGVALAACGATKSTPRGTPPSEAEGGVGGEAPSTAGEAPVIDDPGYVPLHRLTNEEYENTVADLLGTTSAPTRRGRDEHGEFRNDSAVQAHIDVNHAERYLHAAAELVSEVFATPALKARVLVCEAPAAGDAACARAIFEAFGRRAWRRPLEAEELDELVARYRAGLDELEKDHEGAVALVLRIMLTSIKFTYLVELDPDLQQVATEGRDLNGYELAARLSYALWGTAPDESLSLLADSGELTETDVLLGEAARLLDDPRSEYFIRAYLARYLRVAPEWLLQQSFEPSVFPEWHGGLATAMSGEAFVFLERFVRGGERWSQLLTTPLSGRTAGLEGIYAADPPGVRVGFLTLPAFLTTTSSSTRPSAVHRGSLILRSLLCESLVPPSDLVVEVPQPISPEPTNPRDELRQHRANPACAICHEWIDPLGLALENFDALGRYRTEWPSGDHIDPSGVFLSPGQGGDSAYRFADAQELMPLLTADARFARCASQKLLGYLTRRRPRATDQDFADRLGDEWAAGELRDLLRRILVSDVFRRRKLPVEQLP